MQKAVEHGADVTGHRGGLNRDAFPVLDQPAIEGKREGTLARFDAGMQRAEVFNQHKRILMRLVIQIKTAAGPLCSAHHKPVRTDRDFRTKAGMTGRSNSEGSGRCLRVQEALQHPTFDQADPPRGRPFSIKRRCSDVAAVQSVVMKGEEGNRNGRADRLTPAETDAIENRAGIEHAAEGSKQ